MDRRIKTVYYLSIFTLLLMLTGQFYWLYNQYQYNGSKKADEMKPVCAKVIKAEERIRSDARTRAKPRNGEKDTLKININIHIDNRRNGPAQTTSTFTYDLPGKRRIRFSGRGLETEDASTIYNRYVNTRFRPFQKDVLDSLLIAGSLPPSAEFRFLKKTEVKMEPQYRILNRWRKELEVVYCSNPMLKEGVSFIIPIPVSGVIRTMAWQLLISLLFLCVLAFCLIYQVKTILIQKRIDGIRHEFMKNMIFEMKQPREDSSGKNFLRLGNTEFRYDLNELKCGNERVMLTSRQAEIFKLLSDAPNEIVPREQILLAAWGDDSYANSMALNVQISYLRRAIRSDESLAIDVIYKKGYLLRVKL